MPHYAYLNNKYSGVPVQAKFFTDEKETVIRIPGDISKMSKVNMELVPDPNLVYREKTMKF